MHLQKVVLPEEFIGNRRITRYAVKGPHGAVEFWKMTLADSPATYTGKEIHSALPPRYSDMSERRDCDLTPNGVCWHDGASMGDASSFPDGDELWRRLVEMYNTNFNSTLTLEEALNESPESSAGALQLPEKQASS